MGQVYLDKHTGFIKTNSLRLSRQTLYVYQDKNEKKEDIFKTNRHKFGIKSPQKRDKIAMVREDVRGRSAQIMFYMIDKYSTFMRGCPVPQHCRRAKPVPCNVPHETSAHVSLFGGRATTRRQRAAGHRSAPPAATKTMPPPQPTAPKALPPAAFFLRARRHRPYIRCG